ncbi:MAG: phosphatidylserine decarboxylase [Bacillota bacterium]
MDILLKTLMVLLIVTAILGGIVFWLRRVWFFRDPVRVPPQGEGLIIAPADGKVVYVKTFINSEVASEKLGDTIPLQEITKAATVYGDRGWLVGIYMSPLDVHFNYAPITGRIMEIVHYPVSINLPMVDLWEYIRLTYLRRAVDLFSHRYHLFNERLTLFIQGKGIDVAMVEIADKFVNKISSYVEKGQELSSGQKVSFIQRGSQVDLVIFSVEAEIMVKVGQQVYGSLTVIGRYRPAED